MADADKDGLWRDFPKTAPEFEARFATEEDCRAYWIEARWGGKPACAACRSERVWPERGGTLFECAACGHQTSLTSGTLLQGTRKPFKTWFRAVFEISSRRNGISAKDLQRIMGFGSYETAWTWLHKLRVALVHRIIGRVYPERLVDLKISTAAAKDTIYGARRSAGFYAAADAIQDKHGSRKSGMSIAGQRLKRAGGKRKSSPRKNPAQTEFDL